MKSIVRTGLVFLMLTSACFSQENYSPKQTIIAFFDAFHRQDSTQLRSFVHEDIIMQSISIDANGNAKLTTADFDRFVSSISSIPKDQTFKENLLDFEVQIDGHMAHVWTPYEFWYNGSFSHCGVNSFQLLKKEEGWKIIYLVDTRRRDGCNKP